MVTEIEVFTYKLNYWYPHMKPADVAIWERYIKTYPEAFDTVQYDVPCGSVPEFDTVVSPETMGNNAILYKKKIDVVGSLNGALTIVELKPNAGASAIGQIKLYKKLYIKDYSAPDDIMCRIITDKVSNDVLEFAKEEGVEIVIV